MSCGHQCPTVCGENCPESSYCFECANQSTLSRVVDHFEFKTYSDFGEKLDKDPMIVLPCGHFFATSTLDGHMEIQKVYQRNTDGKFVQVLPLDATLISEKARQCPDCRSPIHSVNRYSRITKYGMLRSLQRKHLHWMDERLASLERWDAKKRTLRSLEKVLRDAKASPMQMVFDANGREGDEPQSPSGPIIRACMLIGEFYETRMESNSSQGSESSPSNEDFARARDFYEEAVTFAKSSASARSEAMAHYAVANLLAKQINRDETLKDVVIQHLDLIINSQVLSFPELKEKAESFKYSLSDEARRRDLQEVVRAMNHTRGYNYGTNASSHWYQCPNGHPYFIGECGGAMEESRCNECGERIGGTGHSLIGTNRQWSGLSDLG